MNRSGRKWGRWGGNVGRGVLLGAGVLTLRAVVPPALPHWPAGPAGPAAVEQFLTGALAFTLWVLLGWVALAALATVTAALTTALPGAGGVFAARVATAITPRLLRRCVEVALGVSVAAAPLAVALPAWAASGSAPPWLPAAAAPAASVPLPVLAPAVSPPSLDDPVAGRLPVAAGRLPVAAGRLPVAARGRPGPTAVITVRPGDSLWTLTARALGARSTPARTAAGWPLLWHANTSVIGPDPDLLHPGEQLRLPAGLSTSTRSPAGPPDTPVRRSS